MSQLAAFLGFSAVLLGAVGAHALDLGEMTRAFDTATKYQLIHALLMLYLTNSRKNLFGQICVISGCVFFCGGIYIKAFTGNPVWTSCAPLGGISFMLGWLSVIFYANKNP